MKTITEKMMQTAKLILVGVVGFQLCMIGIPQEAHAFSLKKAFKKAVGAVARPAAKLIDKAKDMVRDVKNAVGNAVRNKVNFLQNVARNTANFLRNSVKNTVNFAKNTATNTVNLVRNHVGNTVKFVKGTLRNPRNILRNATHYAKNTLGTTFNFMKNNVKNAANFVKKNLQNTAKTVMNYVRDTVNYVKEDARNTAKFVKKAASLGKVNPYTATTVERRAEKLGISVGGGNRNPLTAVPLAPVRRGLIVMNGKPTGTPVDPRLTELAARRSADLKAAATSTLATRSNSRGIMGQNERGIVVIHGKSTPKAAKITKIDWHRKFSTFSRSHGRRPAFSGKNHGMHAPIRSEIDQKGKR